MRALTHSSAPRSPARVLGRTALVAFSSSVVGALVLAGPASGWWWGLAWVGFPVVGAFILWRRPGNTMGWLLLLTGACYAVTLTGYLLIGSAPASGSVWFELATVAAGHLGWICLIAIVVLFPSGQAETRAWTWLIRLTVLAAVAVSLLGLLDPGPLEASGRANPLGVNALGAFTGWFFDQGFVMIPLLMIGALVSLVVRWRRSAGIERLQYRWFAFSVVVAVASVFATIPAGDRQGLQLVVIALGMNSVPVAIGVAVTRYRLYEIDRIISRTLSYALVTGALLAVYAIVVTSVTRVLPGTSSSFAVAASTLASAAAFRPVLTKVQSVVDRRFDRRRYDAQRTVDAFAGRLRDEVDSDVVSADLVSVLQTTLQPAGVTLWVRHAS